MKCHECERTQDDTRLQKCPVCHQMFCEIHCHVMSGRPFCSARCAAYFFFEDPEEDS
jgi:hypothetical protein